MISMLKNFFDWIFDTVGTLLDFFLSIIHGFLELFKMFPKISRLIFHAVGYLPSLFVVFVTITITVYIIYLVIGRNAGSAQ